MRATPIGVLPNLETVCRKARIQAKITHDTENGLAAAVGAALLSHYALYHLGPVSETAQFLQKYLPDKLRIPWEGKVGSQGLVAVSAAVTAFVDNTRLSGLLRDCIDFTGDVDTVATIAMAAASCSPEYKNDLPERLYRDLENGPYGAEYLESLDYSLMRLAAI